jgi:hypothetical protein
MTHPWRSFAVFWLLTFVLLGLVPVAQIIFGVASLDFGGMAQGASTRSGVPWTSSLFDVVRLALVDPGLWLLLLGSAVPTLAAFAILVGARDWRGLRDWCDRFNPIRVWRAATPGSSLHVALVLGGIIAGLFLTFELRRALGLSYERPAILLSAALIPALLTAMFLDQGALLEEGGWRGYATPLLQTAGVRPIHAALVVGLAWGLWHLPRDVIGGVVERLGTPDYIFLYLPSFLTGTIAASVLAVFCMNRLGGSVLPAIVVHGLTNDSLGLSGAATIDIALTPLHQLTKAVPLAILALVVWLVARSSLTETGSHARRS